MKSYDPLIYNITIQAFFYKQSVLLERVAHVMEDQRRDLLHFIDGNGDEERQKNAVNVHESPSACYNP